MNVEPLLSLGLRVSAVLGLALFVLVLLRRQSASTRHGVLAAAVATALLVPLASVVLPAWTIGLPASWSATAAAGLDDITTSVGAATGSRPGQAASPVASAGLRGWPMGWNQVVAALWITGIAGLLSRLSIGLVRLSRLARRAVEVDDPRWTTAAASIVEAYGIRTRVRILESDRAGLLVAWASPRPAVLIPRGAAAWPTERIRVVLAHELAHIAAGDWAARLGAELLSALHWFNPLAWMVASRVRLESELACDDAVLRLGENDCDYATQLVSLAREFGDARHAGWPAPAMARRSSLERRVRAMVDTTRNRRVTTRRARLSVFALWLFAATPIALLAQAGPALSGRVTDQSGRPVPGVEVQVAAVDGTVRQTRSGADGRYAFEGLPPGQYSFLARLAGFKQERAAIFLGGRTGTTRDVALSIGSLSEEINIVGRPAAAAAPDRVAVRPAPGAAGPTASADRACVPEETGGDIREPRKIRDVKPLYPVEQYQAGVSGVVTLEGVVTTDGSIRDVTVLSEPHAALGAAAVDAVREWRYTPTLLNCAAVEVLVKITVNFTR